MSSLDDLRYQLASAGYSSEQIQMLEQDVFHSAISFGMNVERVARDLLQAVRAMKEFDRSIIHLANSAGTSFTEMALAVQSILNTTANTEEVSVQPKTKTNKMPYYQRNKNQWWR